MGWEVKIDMEFYPKHGLWEYNVKQEIYNQV